MAFGNSAVSLLFKITADASQASAEMRQLRNTVQREMNAVKNTSNQTDASLSKLSGVMSSFVGNVAANVFQSLTAALVSGGAAALNYSANLEQLSISFDTLTGSAAQSQKFLGEIQEFAKTTPFEFADVAKFSQRLLGANVQLQNVLPLLKDVGNAVSAVGGNQEDLQGTIRALTQIISKGKVSAEEMNQLSERNINGFRILADQLGKTEGEIRKLAEAGEISSGIFVEAFQNFSRANFGDAMAKQSRTFSGAMSNITDAISITSATAFEPLYKKITEITVRLSDELGNAKNFEAVIGKLAEGIGRYTVLAFEELGKFAAINFVKGFVGQDIVTTIADSIGRGVGKAISEGISSLTPKGPTKAQKRADTAEYFKNNPYDPNRLTKAFEDARKPASEMNPILAAVGLNLKNINATAEKIPNLVEKFKAEQAKSQIQALSKITLDLAAKIDFFGQSSEAAAAKQELLKQGITDFGTNGAKMVLLMAERLDKLKETTEKNKAIFDALSGTIKGLTLELTFFGDETKVAATKQQLLNAGITDFDSGMAKQALAIAARIDKLKSAREAQEDYNDKIKDYRSEIQSFSDKAFDDMFPDQSDITKFDRFVGNVKEGLSELRAEIVFTRELLEFAEKLKKIDDAGKRFFTLEKTVEDAIKNVRLQILQNKDDLPKAFSPLTEALYGVAKGAQLARTEIQGLGNKGLTPFDITDVAFVTNFEKYFAQIEKTRLDIERSIEDMNAIGLEASTAIRRKTEADLGKARADLEAFLATLKTLDAKGKETPLFSTANEIRNFIDQIEFLKKSVTDVALQSGLKQIDEVLANLGIRVGDKGFQTGLDNLNKLLADPAITEAIKLRAEALGITAEQLTKVLQAQQAGKDSGITTGTRERVVGAIKKEPDTGFGSGLAKGLGQSIITETDAAGNAVAKFGNVFKTVGDIVGQSVQQMASGVGNLVENFVLMGGAGGATMKKLVASVLAGVAAQAAVLAVMELAYGIAALTPWGLAIYGSPAQHFKAAALFGSIALGAGITGRGVAGDSFNKQTAPGAFGSAGGGNTNQNPRSTTGGAYSGAGDDTKVIEQGRNAPSGLVAPINVERTEINVYKDGISERYVVDALKNNVGRNGELRQLIRALAAE